MSQIKKGAILSYLSIIITLLVALLYTPVMIRLLGQSDYGLYALIGSVAAYFNILDMGLGNAIVRYTSRNRAIGDKKKESKLNGMFLILYSIIGGITIIIGVLIYNTLDVIFAKSLSTTELFKAKIMIIVLVINFALSFPLSIFGSILQAYEKFVVVKLISIARTILIPLATLPFLFLGYGSVAMVIITSIVNIMLLLFNMYYCIKFLTIHFSFEKIDFKLLREIIGYSFFIFLNVIVDQIYWKTDQVILGIVAGTIPVAVYAIGMQFINIYKNFSNALASLFLPKVSIMEARNASEEDFTNIMVKFGRVQFIVMALIFSGFVLFGYPFINIWAGEKYNEAYFIVLLIMIPLTIPLIQNVGISILQAKNLHGFRSTLYTLIAILNILVTIPLVSKYGGFGAALSTGISLTLGHIIIMNIYYHKRIGLNMIYFWKNIVIMSVPVIFSLISGFLYNFIFPQNSIILLIVKIILYVFIYFTLMWWLGMNKYEKDLFKSIIIKFITRNSKKISR